MSQGKIPTSTKTANGAWTTLLNDILQEGDESNPRGMRVLEILDYHAEIDMRYPVVSVIGRKLSRKFMCAEAVWILRGDDRVSTIAPYNKAISEFSDDGVVFQGAYGPRIKDQFEHVVRSLVVDHESRQAVMTIWNKNPPKSRDIPCSISVQFLIRRKRRGLGFDKNVLDTVYNMRSSDGWLGAPYDWFNFTMLSAMVAIEYERRTKNHLTLGDLHFNAGSEHLYEKNWDDARSVLRHDPPDVVMLAPFNHANFKDGDDLLSHLENVRDNNPCLGRSQFLCELLRKN